MKQAFSESYKKLVMAILCLFFLQSYSLFAQVKGVEISHYLYPEFADGVVLMKDGRRNPTKLNYNAATEEMHFKQNERVLALAEPSLSQIDTVFLKNSKFILYKKKFMEVLQQDNLTFLVYYRCKIIPPGNPAAFGGTSQTSSVDSYSSLALDGRVYELKLPDDYDVKPYNVYYLKDGGDWKEFITMRQLKSYYKKNKKQLDAYLKANPVDFNEATEVMKLIQYMENTEH